MFKDKNRRRILSYSIFFLFKLKSEVYIKYILWIKLYLYLNMCIFIIRPYERNQNKTVVWTALA